MAAMADHNFSGIRAHITKAGECEWGQWSEWSKCSKSCEVGRQERKQMLKRPPQPLKPSWTPRPDDFDCVGKKLHHRHCNKHSCGKTVSWL